MFTYIPITHFVKKIFTLIPRGFLQNSLGILDRIFRRRPEISSCELSDSLKLQFLMPFFPFVQSFISLFMHPELWIYYQGCKCYLILIVLNPIDNLFSSIKRTIPYPPIYFQLFNNTSPSYCIFITFTWICYFFSNKVGVKKISNFYNKEDWKPVFKCNWNTQIFRHKNSLNFHFSHYFHWRTVINSLNRKLF